MKLAVFVLLSLFFQSHCSKRSCVDRPLKGESEFKRIKTVLAALSEAVLCGDTDRFTKILGPDDETAERFLDQDQIVCLLQTALDNGHAKLLQRMLAMRSFKEALTYNHLNFSICSCLPDILREMLTVWQVPEELTEDDEDQITKLQQASLSTCPMKIKLLASVFQPFWENVEGCSKRHPSALEYLFWQHHGDDLEQVSDIDVELIWLAGLHCPNDSMSKFFYEWIWIDDPDSMHEYRPTIFLVMEDIIRTIDEGTPETLAKRLNEVDEDETDIIKVCIMTIESIVRRGKYEFLEAIPTDRYSASFLSFKRFYNVFSFALRDGKVDQLNNVLVRLSPSLCLTSMRHFLQDIFDDWVLEGDLRSIHAASDYLFPLLNKTQKGYLHLVSRVFAGDWRFLLVFIEMHPNRTIIADAAWDTILCERPSDNFVNIILNSQAH